MKNITFLILIVFYLNSCKNEAKEKYTESEIIEVKTNENEELITIKNNKDDFYLFNPEITNNTKINNFTIDYSYLINDNEIIIGYYTPINGDGELSNHDSKNNYGRRLLFINKNNELVFKGQGVGDVYLYQPYFYKNKHNNKTLIICHLAYEYFFGGDVFLIENEKISYLGYIDIEGKDEETNLIDILKITEIKDKILFTFDADSITYKPGNEDVHIKNNDVRYEYFNKKLNLIK